MPIILRRSRDFDTKTIQRSDFKQNLPRLHWCRRELVEAAAEHHSVERCLQFQQTRTTTQEFELRVELFNLQSCEFRLREFTARQTGVALLHRLSAVRFEPRQFPTDFASIHASQRLSRVDHVSRLHERRFDEPVMRSHDETSLHRLDHTSTGNSIWPRCRHQCDNADGKHRHQCHRAS